MARRLATIGMVRWVGRRMSAVRDRIAVVRTPNRGAVITSAAMALVVCVGCQTAGRAVPSGELGQAEPAIPRQTAVGQSVEGRAIVCQVIGNGDDTVLILASVHGSEPAGTPLVLELAKHLVRYPGLMRGRRVVLIPVANPDGLARGMRCNARDVDLNRDFPAANWRRGRHRGTEPMSQPESRAIGTALDQYRPARIVSIHQPLGCVDYDGPARALAEAMAAAGGLSIRKLGGQHGSLGSYAGITRGIPIITLELPQSASRLDATSLWRQYGQMLLVAVCFPDRVPPAGAVVGRGANDADVVEAGRKERQSGIKPPQSERGRRGTTRRQP